jgi:hypothetical protein
MLRRGERSDTLFCFPDLLELSMKWPVDGTITTLLKYLIQVDRHKDRLGMYKPYPSHWNEQSINE